MTARWSLWREKSRPQPSNHENDEPVGLSLEFVQRLETRLTQAIADLPKAKVIPVEEVIGRQRSLIAEAVAGLPLVEEPDDSANQQKED